MVAVDRVMLNHITNFWWLRSFAVVFYPCLLAQFIPSVSVSIPSRGCLYKSSCASD